MEKITIIEGFRKITGEVILLKADLLFSQPVEPFFDLPRRKAISKQVSLLIARNKGGGQLHKLSISLS